MSVLALPSPPPIGGVLPPKALRTCPITCEEFKSPWILLEDGFTYEKSAIEQWLRNKPNNSPMIGDIPSATLRPNCAVLRKNPTCPITGQPFQEPYYCVEDGQTYEKEAIIEWFNQAVEDRAEEGIFSVTSHSGLVAMHSLTLVPNKTFFEGGIPPDQAPIIVSIDLPALLPKHRETRGPTTCIYDPTIRELVIAISNTKVGAERAALFSQFRDRRAELGLSNKEEGYFEINLSNLDLSRLYLRNLMSKGCVIRGANFSHSVLVNCTIIRGCLLDCNFEEAALLDCNFEDNAFFGTNMKSAKFHKGALTNARRCNHLGEWKEELFQRGAENTETLRFLSQGERMQALNTILTIQAAPPIQEVENPSLPNVNILANGSLGQIPPHIQFVVPGEPLKEPASEKEAINPSQKEAEDEAPRGCCFAIVSFFISVFSAIHRFFSRLCGSS